MVGRSNRLGRAISFYENKGLFSSVIVNTLVKNKETPKPVTRGVSGNKIAESAPKRTLTISQSEVLGTVSSKGFIKTADESELYLKVMRERLLKTISAGDRVRIR